MKQCKNCGANLQDEAVFCPVCGSKQDAAGAQQQTPPPYGVPPTYTAPVISPFDHTAEFSAKDISENKVVAMLCYLMGTMGIIIAMLASNTSPYAGFHVRQALKFTVLNVLLVVVALILCWTLIVPIACGILELVLVVVRFICFFSICSGKAVEPPIIRSFGFLR